MAPGKKRLKQDNPRMSANRRGPVLILESTFNNIIVLSGDGHTAQVGGFNLVFRVKYKVLLNYSSGARDQALIRFEVKVIPPPKDERVFELDLVLHEDFAVNSDFNVHKLSLSTERELGNPLESQTFELMSTWSVSDLGKKLLISVELRTYSRVHKEQLSKHGMEFMKEVFESRDTSGDVMLVSGTGTEFKVHKLVLAQQSPVLRATFEVDMKEKEQNAVKLEECSDKAVTSLIDFLYKGWTSAIEEEAHEMLQIAHLYQLEKLSNLCWEHVLKTLSKDTVFESLVLADRLGAEDHKIHFAKYLKQNHLDLMETQDFDKFVRENTPLYLEVCKI